MGFSIGNRLLGTTGLSNGFGLSVGNGLSFLGFGAAFSPAELFANGEQGAWYDPSDLTTLFQDSAGTTPVTAVEQPVGLMLDKSRNTVGTNGAKRVNAFIQTENFNTWTKSSVTVNSNATTAPNGTATADKLIATIAAGERSIYQLPASTSVAEIIGCYMKAAEWNYGFLRANDNVNGWTDVFFNLSDGVVVSTGAGWSNATIQSVGSGWYWCAATITRSTLYRAASIGASSTGTSTSDTGDGTSGIFIWGADLRLASEASTAPTPYQRIDADWASTMAGNHAFQTTLSARPTYSARYNLLAQTEAFNEAVWSKSLATISANATAAPDGTSTADKILEMASSGSHYVRQGSLTTAAANYVFTVYLKAAERNWAILVCDTLNGTNGSAYVFVDLTNGAFGSQYGVNGYTFVSKSISNAGDGWWRVSMTFTANARNDAGAGVFVSTGNDVITYAGNASNGLFVWGADLRVANEGVGLPVYQRVGVGTSGSSTGAGSSDYDTVGFPLYLRFDGSDDFLRSTFTISQPITRISGLRFPRSTTNTQVFGGVITNAGAMYFGSATTLGLFSGVVLSGPTVAIPGAYVTREIHNGASSSLTVNTSATSSGNAGTVLPGGITIGASNGGTTPSAINLYSLVQVNGLLTAQQISDTEAWVNGKTRAY
ncbi:MAG: hypothetical protein ABFD60_15255 [Bryobacteraceae bacterium]